MVSIRPGSAPGAALFRAGLTVLSVSLNQSPTPDEGQKMSEKVTERNRRILEAAAELAAERGYTTMTRADIAQRAGVADGSVNNAFGTMDGLRDAVMQRAVDTSDAEIVAQGLAARHPVALGAPQALKDQASATLAAAA